MDQKQLQTARAALWHQNAAPLDTYDDAAPWFEEIGFCLFLPRHAQFPSPAPSLVEACIGATSATPPPAAIQKAMNLATRLVDAARAVPLNLLGTFSEHPDFLVTPDALPWVAAVRGDRQWKTAPGGRTAPIVLRTWEALEKNGAQTAGELREALGREVTEAAVLRALIELWTAIRVLPLYAASGPTRWHLMKDRYAAQLTTGSNTAQPTALSALASLYLRSAVAATAEEAEVFLSPLTARSRIREVLHGMTAARQFGTMSVGSHTLLFVEGSLPEVAPVEEAELQAAAQPEPFRPRREPRDASGREKRRPDQEGRRRDQQRPGREDRRLRDTEKRFPPRRDFSPAASGEERKGRGDRPREEGRPSRPFEKKRAWQPRDRKSPAKFQGPRREGQGQERPPRREDRGERKPWQKRPGGEFQKREGRPPFRKPFAKPKGAPGERDERPRFGKGPRRESGSGRPPFGKGPRREDGANRPHFGKGPREGGGEQPQFGKGLRREDRGNRPQFGSKRPQFGGKRFEGRPPQRREEGGENRPPRPGKKFGGPTRFGKPGDRPPRREFGGNRPERGPRSGFRPGSKGRGAFRPSSLPPRPKPRGNRGEKPGGEEGAE